MTMDPPQREPVSFGKYLLLEPIAQGGMAEVWRAKWFGEEGRGQLVAVKRILPFLAEAEEFITMFLDEGKISLQLVHPNLVRTFEQGQIGPDAFLSMEYIAGKPLRALFERSQQQAEPLPMSLACYCIAKAAEGLDHAHRLRDAAGRDLNIIHRGLSLDDVLVSYGGEVKVIDFGVAKAEGRMTQTQPGIIKGRFGYLSPEQIESRPLDRRSDVFTLGVCLYELLTGRRLFAGASAYETVEMGRTVKLEPPSTHNPLIPKALEQVVLKALAPDVNERHTYASELAADLQRFLTRGGVSFGQEQLRQYMRATFREEAQREAQLQKEHASNPRDACG